MYVAQKVAKHEFFTFLYLKMGLLLKLYQLEIYFLALFTERERDMDMEFLARFPDMRLIS